MKYNIFSTLTPVLGRFFTDPDFSGSDPDFWPIRIRTQEKNSDPDPAKKTGSETLLSSDQGFGGVRNWGGYGSGEHAFFLLWYRTYRYAGYGIHEMPEITFNICSMCSFY